MNTEYFYYLLTIAQYRSISQAADALHLQRSYLSKVVQNIEQELDMTIFTRSPRGVLITQEGEYALKQLQQVLDILDEVKRHGQAQKDIIYAQYFDEITVMSPKKIRPCKRSAQYLPAFQKLFPNVLISMIDEDVENMIHAVEQLPLSVAFTLRTNSWDKLCPPIPDTMVYQPITNNPIVALASPNNALAQEYKTMSLASLAKQELVFMDFTVHKDGFLRHLLQPYGTLHIRYTVSSMALFYQLLHDNPYFSIGIYSPDANDNLLQIPLRDDIYIEQGILYHKDTLHNVVGKKFIELLLESYQK